MEGLVFYIGAVLFFGLIYLIFPFSVIFRLGSISSKLDKIIKLLEQWSPPKP